DAAKGDAGEHSTAVSGLDGEGGIDGGTGEVPGRYACHRMILPAFEDDHRNHSLGSLLVLGKRGPDPGHLLIEPVALLAAVNNPGAGLDLLGPVVVRHLDLDLGGCLDIPEPQRMVRGTTLRSHDDVVVSLAAINQGGRDGLAA